MSGAWRWRNWVSGPRWVDIRAGLREIADHVGVDVTFECIEKGLLRQTVWFTATSPDHDRLTLFERVARRLLE